MIADPDFYLQSPYCFDEVIFQMRRRKGDIQSDAECLKAANVATAYMERILESARESNPSKTLLTGYLSRFLAASIYCPNLLVINFILDYWDQCASLSNVQRYLNEFRHQAAMSGEDQELASRVREKQQGFLQSSMTRYERKEQREDETPERRIAGFVHMV